MKYYGNELYHHGILGQKWGIRRFQNEDGTLTAEGRKRLARNPDKTRNKIYKQVRKERSRQSDWSNQWAWSNSIGAKSKSSIESHQEKINKIHDKYRPRYKDIDDRFDSGKIDITQGFSEIEKVDAERDKELKDIGALKVVGKRYSKKAMNSLSEMNISYMEDLGYSRDDAEYIDSILRKSKKYTIY